MPYIPASKAQVNNVLTLLRGRKGGLVDLGSGDGRIVCIIKIFRFLILHVLYVNSRYLDSVLHTLYVKIFGFLALMINQVQVKKSKFLTLVIIYPKGPGSVPAWFHPSYWL